MLGKTIVPSEIREHQRSKDSFNLLAQNEDWLTDNFDKVVRSYDIAPEQEATEKLVDSKSIAETDGHFLRSLGAAVIMRWKMIPTNLQRELFDTAGSLGNVLQTTASPGQIARFLHDRKDGEVPANCISESSVPKG